MKLRPPKESIEMANGIEPSEDAEHAEKRRQRIEKQRKEHPHGFCLVARDTEANRRLFPEGPFGKMESQ